MKTFTHTHRAGLLLAIVLSSALTGCATINASEQKLGSALGIKNQDASAGVVGGAAGCAGGALLGHYLLHTSALAGCAVGGVVGATASIANHRSQVAKAKALAAEVNAAPVKGLHATVSTSTATVSDESGKAVQDEKLDRLAIVLPAAKVAAHAEDVQQVLTKAAVLADGSDQATTLEISGTAAQRTWMAAQIRGALKTGSSVKVIESDAPSPGLVISPIPSVAKQGS